MVLTLNLRSRYLRRIAPTLYVSGFVALVTDVRFFHTLGRNHIYAIRIQLSPTLSSPVNSFYGPRVPLQSFGLGRGRTNLKRSC